MADSQEHSSGFWTLTRPSKLSKRRNSDLHELHHKVFNISVVGLSGVEKDKGPIGIGKSCLCNRFVRSAADDYYTDHISVLSQSDFSGRVVNNDHWMYWGTVIKSCDGYDLAFNVIEQTEFVDDACFQPFKSGKTEPYFKRCANTKLVSAEKLMYICKSQLGIEREYEQRYLPDGKFNVDGFLCLFDVSEVQGRNIDKQIEMTNLIMLNLIKTRKPIVFVTTKHDEASDLLLAEAERLVNQRDFRGIVPIVETSAQDNININMAFLVCAQLIDKTRAKLRVPPYFEAYKNHQDLLNAASEAYLNLIRGTIVDYRSSWQQVCMKLSHNPEFLQYTYLHGLDSAAIVFNNHIKRLRDECINQKVQTYFKIFPEILNEIETRNTSNSSINNNNNSPEIPNFPISSPQAWESTKEKLRSHPLFNKYFIQVPAGISWYDTELLQSPDTRIPVDWLNSDEAFSIFQQHNLVLETEQRRDKAKKLFSHLLSKIDIPVGKPFIEIKHLFASNSDLELLSDQEQFETYVEHQNNLLQRSRADFQELLLENAEHLHHLTSSNKVIRQEDIKTINAILQHDDRYQALDRFDQDRTLMMIRHLSFLHSQISEQCPSYPKCVEPEIERLLITKAKALVNRYFENKNDVRSTAQKTCDLVIFGPRRPSQQLILALNVLNSRALKSSQYQITFTVFDNADDVDTQIQRFRQSNTKPKGCFGIFTNQRSLEHVSYTLERFLILNSQIRDDKNHFGNPPIVMLYAADITLDERTMLALENEGQQVADKFKCPFMNVTAIDQYRQHQQNNILSNDQDSVSQVMSECASLDYACVDAAFNVLKEAVSRRVCFMELYNNQDLIPRQAFNPDARILMCLLCGEPFSNELFLWKMFLDYEDCYVTSSKSICLKAKLNGGQEKFIEIIITSYTHGAFNYREDLLHGFILVCSTRRKASISILNAFSFNIPCTPMLVMSIKSDSTQSSSQISDEESDGLINEAKLAAKRLKGHFEMLDMSQFQNGNVNSTCNVQRIRGFLQDVIKRKPMIEKAYELGDNDLPLTSSLCSNEIVKKKFSEKATVAGRLNFRRAHHTLSSSDEDLNDNSNPTDRNLSDDSVENHSLESNSAPPKPIRVTKQEIQEHHYSSTTEQLLAKRPLPPLPSSEVYDPDWDIDNTMVSPPIQGTSELDNSNKRFQVIRESAPSSSEDEDSSNKQEKPKPGKLDLRQFDNITNAIGKLNVQPTIKSSEVTKPKSASKVPKASKASKDLPKPASRSTTIATTTTTTTTSTNPTGSATSFATTATKRISNPRQNHGRAVAPPKLPSGSFISTANKIDSETQNEPLESTVTSQSSGDDTGIDYSQSPIAQRLLKYSLDHKVSELNSPYESDCEPSTTTQSTNILRGHKILRGQSLGYENSSPSSIFKNSSIDSSELLNSRGAAIRQLNEILANKQPPRRPGDGKQFISRASSLDQEQQQSSVDKKKEEKDSKKDKKKLRDDEKLEKRRLKEEERLRRQEKKLASKKSKSNATGPVDEDGIPFFIKRCIEFIESEGLDAEGIYRVPGNRAHVDAFVQKFKENPEMDMLESDIPVNAVATALKDFLSKKWGPIIPLALMNELTDISTLPEKDRRTEAVHDLIKKLPPANYKLLKYVISHFVKVSMNHSLNSMDSKNLAICWWPTLLPLHFSDMAMFEQMRPHLEESIQTMIDQYKSIFEE